MTTKPVPVCVHRQPPTGERVRCTVCKGAQLTVFGCGVFGRCTLARPGAGVEACCVLRGVKCERFEEPGAESDG
jgi:hypothetical protein